MNGNGFVTFMLRSPLHGLLGNTMLITVTGRRTGRQITLPVSYFADGDTLWIMSTRKRTWWRNVLPGAQVQLHVHGRAVKGLADVVLDQSAVANRLAEYVHRLPFSARALGVRVQNGVANPEDAARLARERLFVGVCMSEAAG